LLILRRVSNCTGLSGYFVLTYGWDLASLEGREDAIELELAIDILLLDLDVGWSVDLGRHDDE
jgi:hypothetical protein